MGVPLKQLHPCFVAEVGNTDISTSLDRPTLDLLAEAIGRYAVLIFRGQNLTDEQQIEFVRLCDCGRLGG